MTQTIHALNRGNQALERYRMMSHDPSVVENDEPYIGKRVLVFEGQGLVVYARFQDSEGPVVVTFNGRGDTKPNREGQGEAFFDKYKISSVHFISTDNHWWQSVDFEAGLKVVKALLEGRGIKDIVTYGSSMGGYGALAASGVLNAIRVIAITPQFTVDPEIVPWDRRFIKDARKLTFIYDDLALHMAQTDIVIISDPFFEVDQRHVNMIGDLRPIRQLSVAFAEHFVAPAVVDCGLLSQTILGLVLGELDFKWFRNALRKARGKSWCILAGASRFQHRKGRLRSALILGAKAYSVLMAEKVRGNRVSAADFMIEGYATILADANMAREGLTVLDEWAQYRGSKPYWLTMLKSRLCETAGDSKEALQLVMETLERFPGDRHALSAACKLMPTAKKMKSFYRKSSEICLKYPSSSKAMATRLRQLGLHEMFDTFIARAILAHPNEAPKLRSTFRLSENVAEEK